MKINQGNFTKSITQNVVVIYTHGRRHLLFLIPVDQGTNEEEWHRSNNYTAAYLLQELWSPNKRPLL
jgi:predicted AAA+ superfamily ATPase